MDKNSLMHRLNPKYIRLAGIVAASLLVILLIGGYIAYTKREGILQHEITKAKAKAKSLYHLNLQIGSAHFTGLTTITCTDITIVPENRDSLLTVKHFDVSIKLWPLLFGNIKLANVDLLNGHLNLTDLKGIRNFDFLFKKKADSTQARAKVDLSELSNNLIKQVLYKIPDNLIVNNFLVSFTNDSTKLKLLTQTAKIDDGDLTSTLKINDTVATWHFAGTMHPSDKLIDIRLYADNGKVEIPFIEKRFHARVNFDNITVKLTNVKHSDGETRIETYCSAHNLLVNQPGLAANDIIVQDGSIAANVFVGSNYISLDSSSVIHLKKMSAHPFIKYTLKPVKIYELKLSTGWQNAQDIFDSFPTGMFESLDGIKVAGKLNYSLNFYLNTKQPDSLKFDSRMDKDPAFRILKYGKTDLGKLNRPFVYTPYVKDKPMPPHLIGPQNPDYTPLEEMSPYLRNAVMTAEDPTFYKNHGFVEKAIRQSIVTDIKDHKFKRGGSTISMQLVKNSFLNQKKTLNRKIEEILIVWLIENNNIMTKDRMLEVYFNIIEWGPGIYGISEASHYYFGKAPSELTLGESIFLASIVPRPRAGLYAFLPDGSLRPGLENYFNSLGRMMMGKGFTQADSSSYGFYTVQLKASLRRKITPVDSAAASKILNAPGDDDIDIPIIEEPQPAKKPNFFQRLFGKKDTVVQKTEQMLKDEEQQRINAIDPTGKTKKQIRQEKRAIKQQEKEKRQALKDQGKL
ncbi:biosynthetic peptidoglycan transglycosylase [Mucilaginibacter sp. UR6-11]|uniref:biosynthetic peptidoglycan transglycosylase n=1 Tax=Mucilaginibacter sp. UR6-11 TaxID=1435644 RepID=UPI001E5ECD3C|nr:biosynthetic peptidoglycan transglycosylase [Mucilaginibacter sp. UR6-11]MCC8424520.1 transglycosylase domain-containing protein [Mucilaginibacter sp. UR6-11]